MTTRAPDASGAGFTVAPLRHDDGGIRGVIGAGFDVTDGGSRPRFISPIPLAVAG